MTDAMVVATTCKRLEIEEALTLVEDGAAFIDLRPTAHYLDAHIPGSLALLWEFGPGLAGRARDCIPLSVPFVICDPGTIDVGQAANAFRGKGFTVLGRLEDPVNGWARGTSRAPASTEVVSTPEPPGGTILDVGDPGVSSPRPPDLRIPLERLWARAGDLEADRVVLATGYGVRAAIAVGILERAGIESVFWRTRA